MSALIYLDNHATTPCDPRVVEAMLPYFTEHYGNPSSTHGVGIRATEGIEVARKQVAVLIGAQAAEIVFTSGATESNNLAIFGTARQHEKIGGARRRIVTSVIEHKAVLGPCLSLAESGWEVIILPVVPSGTVDLQAAAEAINEDTLLVSIQAANHEIGTIQPVHDLARLAHEHGALVHCDAAQAVGKIPLHVNEWDIDLLSLSGHKLYGPKGIGALWIRGGPRRLPLEPLTIGGGQESSLRPGTPNVPAIVGLGMACALCAESPLEERDRIGVLRDTLERNLSKSVPHLRRNGDSTHRLPGNSNLTFPGIDAEALLLNLNDVAVSMGSACDSGAIGPSRVLTSIGVSEQDAFSTLRFGLGRFTTVGEIESASEQISLAYHAISSL